MTLHLFSTSALGQNAKNFSVKNYVYLRIVEITEDKEGRMTNKLNKEGHFLFLPLAPLKVNVVIFDLGEIARL